jgi:hypothetical protein
MFIQGVGVQDFDATRFQLIQKGIKVLYHKVEYLHALIQGQEVLRENNYVRGNDAE